MNPQPWIKLYTEARNDAKLRSLTDAQHRVWFRLLLLAAEQERRGTIGPIRVDLLALEVSDRNEALLLETLDVLVSLCCAEVDHEALRSATRALTVRFVRFAQRQKGKPSESPERKNARAAKSRANKKLREHASNNGAPMCASAAPPVAPRAPKRRLDSSDDDPSSSAEESPAPPFPEAVSELGVSTGRTGKDQADFLRAVEILKGHETTSRLADYLSMEADHPEVASFDGWRLVVAATVARRPDKTKSWNALMSFARQATLDEFDRYTKKLPPGIRTDAMKPPQIFPIIREGT
jgi:hypothetical protein